MTRALLLRYLIYPLLVMIGAVFAYRLTNIPSRMETAVFCIAFFVLPTLKYPKIGVYYLFCLSLFIPLFRRMYYLVGERPALDYLMLISDGVMGGLILALILLWILNKEKPKDLLSILVVCYALLLFAKVFVGNQSSVVEGLYGFKFNGLYVLFFFAGSYILTSFTETRMVLGWASWLMLTTAFYAIKQILFGFTAFEQKWLDSITFTTLRIEGVVRPFSTYLSPAALSDGMTLLFLLGTYWIVTRGRHMALFGLLLCGSSVAPLLIATVRTNWLAVIAGLFFYLFYLRLEKKWIKYGIMAIMILGLAAYLTKGSGDSGGGQYSSLIQANRKDKSLTEIMIKNRTAALANPLQEYSVQKRMETWVGIMYTSLVFPFGKGQGTTGYAHSYYFQVLGEIGYPGLLAFLAILIVGFYRGFRILSLSRDPEILELTRLLLTLLFMLSILNTTGTHLHTPPGDIFFWFSMGVISRFYRQTLDGSGSRKSGAEGPEAGADARNWGSGTVTAFPGGMRA